MPKPPKIPARIRRAAIEALELAASNAKFHRDGRCATDIYREFGLSGPVDDLMMSAWLACPGADRASLAEAASLLRDDWSPGEPVTYR